MNVKQCEKCEAKWLNGQLYWSTGKSGTEEDLAGLVCNTLVDEDDREELLQEKPGSIGEDILME